MTAATSVRSWYAISRAWLPAFATASSNVPWSSIVRMDPPPPNLLGHDLADQFQKTGYRLLAVQGLAILPSLHKRLARREPGPLEQRADGRQFFRRVGDKPNFVPFLVDLIAFFGQ